MEVLLIADLVQVAVCNTQNEEQGSIVVHVDNKRTLEEIESEELKATELVRDKESIASIACELTSESKVLFELMHAKKRENYDEVSDARGKQLEL